MHAWWILHLLIGLGVSQSVIVHWSLPDPAPWLVRLVAGGLGGILGAWIAMASSDQIPAGSAIGAIFGAALLVGLTHPILGGSRAKVA